MSIKAADGLLYLYSFTTHPELPMFKQLYQPYLLTVYIFFAGLIIHSPVFSQTEKKESPSFFKNSSVGVRAYVGSFLTTQPKAVYVRDSYASFGEIYFQQQTTGKKDWQVTHRYPQWGLSFLYGNTGSKEYIGKMSSVYGYVNIPFVQSKRYSGNIKLGAGPGWVTKPFDINTNPKNTLIGTTLNVFINMSLINEFKLSNRVYLDAGIGFMHLSNGGTTLPNLGLNTPNIFGGLRYSFSEPVIEKRTMPDDFEKKMVYKVYTTIAFKMAPWVGGEYYLINTVQGEAMRRIGRNHGISAGVMFFYDRTLQYFPMESPNEVEERKKLQIGLYGGYEHFLGKLSLPVQIGFYAYNKDKSLFTFTQFGLRYQFTPHFSGELLLKSHGGQADFIHTGIGYTF